MVRKLAARPMFLGPCKGKNTHVNHPLPKPFALELVLNSGFRGYTN
jgi:hypothetical protein